MTQDFYPFVENGTQPQEGQASASEVRHPARIAVYDDAAAAPRVVVVEPKDVRAYLEEITLQVTQLAQQQGGTIPFMVIREIVENFIHAYFMEPTISILDHGNTIRFSDQGPGIREKDRALQYGTTSATEEMRRYIRGVGSGLPYAQQYMVDKGGSLEIDDNIAGGTVVTISTRAGGGVPAIGDSPLGLAPLAKEGQSPMAGTANSGGQAPVAGTAGQGGQAPVASTAGQWGPPPAASAGVAAGAGMPAPYPPAAAYPQVGYPQAGYPVQGAYQPQGAYAPAAGWAQQQAYPVVPAQDAYQQQGVYATPMPQPAWPAPTVRGRAVLDYLRTHDAVGPSDLARTYGESQPTWTRELQALEEQGFLRKDGQKRRLTAMGQAYLAQG